MLFDEHMKFRRQAFESEQRDTNELVGTFKNQNKPVLTPHMGISAVHLIYECPHGTDMNADQTIEEEFRRVRHHLTKTKAQKYLDDS